MSLRTQFFVAILAVAACVSAAIVTYSTFVTGVTLHQHPSHDASANLTAPMRAVVASLAREAAATGRLPQAISSNPDLRSDWNVVVADPTGRVVASSQTYLVGVRLSHAAHFVVLSSAPSHGRGFRDRIGRHLVPEAPLADASGRTIATVAFLPTEAAIYDISASANQDRLARLFWAAAIVALVASAVASAILAGYLLEPLRALKRAATRMSDGDLAARVAPSRAGEVRDVGDAFNRMAARLERAERLRTEMTSDIAHELRTPINNVQGQLEAIEAGLLAPTPERIRALKDEMMRLGELVADLGQLSLADSGQLQVVPGPIAPRELLDSTIARCDGLTTAKNVALAIDCPADVPLIEADVRSMRHVLLNLVANAIRHAPINGHVTLGARPAGPMVEIWVADDGTGIAPDDLEDIFERFYRSDAARGRDAGGSGLGLAIARRLVEADRGTIRAENISGGGARLTFTVPLFRD